MAVVAEEEDRATAPAERRLPHPAATRRERAGQTTTTTKTTTSHGDSSLRAAMGVRARVLAALWWEEEPLAKRSRCPVLSRGSAMVEWEEEAAVGRREQPGSDKEVIRRGTGERRSMGGSYSG